MPDDPLGVEIVYQIGDAIFIFFVYQTSPKLSTPQTAPSFVIDATIRLLLGTIGVGVKLLKLSLEYQIESHEHRLAWIKNGDDSEWIRSQELTQLSFEAEQVGLKSFNDAKTGIEQ